MTDSKGTPLPEHITIGYDPLISVVQKSMSITRFRHNVKDCMKKGLEVVYNPNEKKAEVIFPDGEKSVIEHL